MVRGSAEALSWERLFAIRSIHILVGFVRDSLETLSWDSWLEIRSGHRLGTLVMGFVRGIVVGHVARDSL